jgi:hypothetical protein
MVTARLLFAGVALGMLALAPQAFARGGGGGGHGGGAHFSGIAHMDAPFGAAHHGGNFLGATHFDHMGVAQFPGDRPAGIEWLPGREHVNRNAFGDRTSWIRWGNHYSRAGWRRWGEWYGPVFWPYLYGDVFSYTLGSGAYGAPFWAHGSRPLLSSIYRSGPYDGADAPEAGVNDVYGSGGVALEPIAAPDMTSTCGGLAPGVVGVPVDQMIAQAVLPDGDQIQALIDLGTAAARASEIVRASCSGRLPRTPLERLDAVDKRLKSMIEAVQIVRPHFERFYDLLNEGQKARLFALVQPTGIRPPAGSSGALCDPRAAGVIDSSVDGIKRTLQPTAQQEPAFAALKAASAAAAASLDASCPATQPRTPVERLDAVQNRLEAMVQAARSVRPALAAFYTTLSDQQKARFNMPMAFASVHR